MIIETFDDIINYFKKYIDKEIYFIFDPLYYYNIPNELKLDVIYPNKKRLEYYDNTFILSYNNKVIQKR